MPRLSVPLRLFWMWAVIIGGVLAWQEISRGGWPPGSYIEFGSSVIIGGCVGGYVWAWLYWRSLASKKDRKPK